MEIKVSEDKLKITIEKDPVSETDETWITVRRLKDNIAFNNNEIIKSQERIVAAQKEIENSQMTLNLITQAGIDVSLADVIINPVDIPENDSEVNP